MENQEPTVNNIKVSELQKIDSKAEFFYQRVIELREEVMKAEHAKLIAEAAIAEYQVQLQKIVDQYEITDDLGQDEGK